MKKDELYKEFFGAHADEYAKSSSHAKGDDLFQFVELMKPEMDQKCADMATGTGFTAIEFAKRCNKVYAIDGTRHMLEKAEKLALENNLKNVEFVESSVETTPLKDESVDMVTCRRAAHHFHDKNRFLKEANRILKKGGKIGIVDMIRNEEDGRDIRNRLEIIRDPSHFYAPTASQWKEFLADNGFKIFREIIMAEPYTYEKWLYPVKIGGKEDLEAMKLIAGESDIDLNNAGLDREKMSFEKKRIIIVAIKS